MESGEKVKKGLGLCSVYPDKGECIRACPYECEDLHCIPMLSADALAYIHQLEAKLAEYEKPLVPLTWEEAMEDDYYLERMGDRYVDVALNELALDGDLGFIVFDTHEREEVKLMRVDYGKTWRCWPRRPTDEERKAAKWDE